MSTDKNTPDDETQVMDVVDKTQQPVDETETTVQETAPLVDETEVLPALEELPEAGAHDDVVPEPVLAETQPLAAAVPTIEDEPTPTRTTPVEDPDPFELFSPAPAASEGWQPAPEPAVVVEPRIVEPAAGEADAGRRRLRVGTVVWGLVLAACGLGVIAWASGARIDFQLALIVLLAAAGVALLVGSIVSGARHARR